MLRVETAKVREILAGANLQVVRQRHTFQPGFFQFHSRLAAVINEESNRGVGAEIRIHRALQVHFRALDGEAALVRIMPAQLQRTDVVRRRAAHRKRPHHAQVGIGAAFADADGIAGRPRLRENRRRHSSLHRGRFARELRLQFFRFRCRSLMPGQFIQFLRQGGNLRVLLPLDLFKTLPHLPQLLLQLLHLIGCLRAEARCPRCQRQHQNHHFNL